MNKYRWPLATDPFTLWDRLKICWFLLDKRNMLTMGPKVAEFEEKMSKFSGSYALAVSSGSAANFLIFELWKQKHPDKFDNALVICPAVSWVSSITPALHCGYNIQFCDINLNDFCFDYTKLEQILEDNKNKHLIIWPTALIGNVPDFIRLRELAKKYRAELFCDCAENTFSNFDGKSILNATSLSTTSCYWSHEIVSVEFGFVFFKDYDDYIQGKLLRNHGLIRSLEPNNKLRVKIEKQNPTIDREFLFAVKGTNLRSTDIHAVWGLCDFKRIDKYKKHRKDIYKYYYD
ncbi:MAG: DegT/DnrJ/EryC1/StrS family aminotransferase, partial [Nanoarchaeota archaeon]